MEEVLAVPDLDAAIISSTPNVHYAQARAALERGLHVLIEKPMTITAKEADELVKLAEKKKLQFLISCPWHFTSHGIAAQKLVQSGALGEIKMISVLMTNFTDGLYKGLPWEEAFGKNPPAQNRLDAYLKPGRASYSDPKVSGGGQIYCQVSHAAGHLGFLTGQQPVEIFARFDNAGTEVDVYDTLNIKLDGGTIVSMASTGATMLSERNNEVRVYGTKGMLFMELWKGKMEFYDLDGNVKREPDLPESDIYPMFAPAENLVDAILGRAPNRSPATLGLFAMKIIEGACQSARENKNIRL